MRQFLVLAAVAALGVVRADIVTCACDPSHPETLEARQCSLCREAEQQPAGVEVFILKDKSATKPGRWLVLPRAHERSFELLTREQRIALLKAAVAKGRELFGDAWGIAYNAPEVQTQCHVHLHVGKWMPAVENARFVTVKSVEDVPALGKGEGFWIHPVNGALHVHTGEPITETVLER